MPRQRLLLITLEDFRTPTGQGLRLAQLIPELARHAEIVPVVRRGARLEDLASYITERIELPLEAEARPVRQFLHPAGPARWAKLRGALSRLNNPDAVLYADSVFLAALARRSPHRRLVAEVNGVLSFELKQRGNPVLRVAASWMERLERHAARRPDRLIAVSQNLADHLARRCGVEAARIHVIGNGIDPHRFRPGLDGASRRRELGWLGHAVGAFAGSFQPYHGVENLLRAVPEILKGQPDFKLLLVGDGPRLEAARALARELSLNPHLRFVGRVAPAEVPGWLAAADVGLYLPGYGGADEPFLGDPMKIYEMAAVGLPVLTTLPWVSPQVQTPGIVRLTDAAPQTVARALNELLNDTARLCALGQEAAQAVQRHHTWGAIADRIAEVCFGVASAG